eukprot:357392-Chlamydomonas_euryale.AAC.57
MVLVTHDATALLLLYDHTFIQLMQAVAQFYKRLVSGTTCLTQLGLLAATSGVVPFISDIGMQDQPSTPMPCIGSSNVACDSNSATESSTGTESFDCHVHDARTDQECIKLQRDLRKAKKRARDKRQRITYQIELAYFGPTFHGWMQQPGYMTVEGAMLAALHEVIPRGTPRPVFAAAGRTDKGVTAAAQVRLPSSACALCASGLCAIRHSSTPSEE